MTELDPTTRAILRGLAKKVHELDGRVRDQARASQARDSSLEGGGQYVYDDDGELRAVLGALEDGSYGMQTFGGTPPAAPSMPLVSTFPGGATVTWDGFDLNDEQTWGEDFARVTFHVSTLPGDYQDVENQVGSTSSPDGFSLTFAQPPDVTCYCTLIAWNRAGMRSEPSVEVEVVSGAMPTLEPPAPDAPIAPEYDITGMPRGIMVQVTNGQPGWVYTYTITDTNDESTPDVVASFPDTPRPVFYTETMPDGTPLSASSNGYKFTVKATNPTGSATSPESDVQPLVLNDSNTIAELAVGKLAAGDLVGAFALLGALKVGDNITIDPVDGIVVHTPLGDTKIPADGQNPQFTGSATFNRLTTLGDLAIMGLTNEVTKGSRVELATATGAPKVSPVLSAFWPSGSVHDGFNPQGWTRHAATGRYYHTESIYGGSVTATTRNGDRFDFAFKSVSVNGSSSDGGALNRPEVLSARGGVAIMSNMMYVLCETNESIPGTYDPRWYVYKAQYQTATDQWTYAGRFLYEPTTFLGGYSSYKPAIGVRESTGEVIIAQTGNGGTAAVTGYNPSTGTVNWRNSPKDYNLVSWKPERDMIACEYAVSESGVERLNILAWGEHFTRAYATATLEQVDEGFPLPSHICRGLLWDQSTSHFRSRTGDTAYRHTAILNKTIGAVQTWRKADGTAPDYAQFETDKGPATYTTTFPRRAALRIQSGPIPDDSTDPNDPDSTTFYVSLDVSGTNTSFRRQTVPAVGATVLDLSSIGTDGGNPPGVSSFPSGTPAQLVSDAADTSALVRLSGDGSWRLGAIRGDAAGNVHGGALVPIAGVIPFFGRPGEIPEGWLPCNNLYFLATDYPRLAAKLSYAFQVNDTTWRTPQFSDGYFPVGAGNARGGVGNVGGSTSSPLPDHWHYSPGNTEGPSGLKNVQGGTNSSVPGAGHSHTIPNIPGIGSFPSVSTIPPYLACDFIIRAA